MNNSTTKSRQNKYTKVETPGILKLYECPIFSTHNTFIKRISREDEDIIDIESETGNILKELIDYCKFFPVCIEIDLNSRNTFIARIAARVVKRMKRPSSSSSLNSRSSLNSSSNENSRSSLNSRDSINDLENSDNNSVFGLEEDTEINTIALELENILNIPTDEEKIKEFKVFVKTHKIDENTQKFLLNNVLEFTGIKFTTNRGRKAIHLGGTNCNIGHLRTPYIDTDVGIKKIIELYDAITGPKFPLILSPDIYKKNLKGDEGTNCNEKLKIIHINLLERQNNDKQPESNSDVSEKPINELMNKIILRLKPSHIEIIGNLKNVYHIKNDKATIKKSKINGYIFNNENNTKIYRTYPPAKNQGIISQDYVTILLNLFENTSRTELELEKYGNINMIAFNYYAINQAEFKNITDKFKLFYKGTSTIEVSQIGGKSKTKKKKRNSSNKKKSVKKQKK